MNKKILLLGLILVFVLIVGILYFTLPKKVFECVFDEQTEFNLCYYDAKTGKMVPYTMKDVSIFYSNENLLSNVSMVYDLKAGDYITYLLNISRFNLPDSYYLCVNGIKPINSSEYVGDLKLFDYDSNTNIQFACISQPYTTSNHIISGSGILPCMPEEVTFLEVYIFPDNFTGTSINEFKNNINLSQKIFAVYGEIIC